MMNVPVGLTFNSGRIIVNLNHVCQFFFILVHGDIVQA